MPPGSSDSHAECAAARSSAAVFELSARSQVELAGPDAAIFLHNLCTNDIKTLPAGRGCEFFLTSNKARVVGHGFALRLLPAQPVVMWLDLDPGSGAKVVAHLNHYLVTEQVEIADRTAQAKGLHLCGPHANELLARALPGVPPLDPLQHHLMGEVRITRHDRLGLPGFDLVCPSSAADELRDKLLQAGGAGARPDAFNILRIEAGVPVDGLDIDAERFVVEVGRTKQAICYTKGCYLGQEPIVMARDRGQVNRMLLGLKIAAAEPVAAGTKATSAGQEVGQVTSSVWSPLLGTVIGLAYIKRGSQDPGTVVDVAGHKAEVASLPFGA